MLNKEFVPYEQAVYTIFGTDRSEEYKTYEEAELACLKKLIEVIKHGKS